MYTVTEETKLTVLLEKRAKGYYLPFVTLRKWDYKREIVGEDGADGTYANDVILHYGVTGSWEEDECHEEHYENLPIYRQDFDNIRHALDCYDKMAAIAKPLRDEEQAKREAGAAKQREALAF
jgi:hypothetical protein